MPLKPFPSPRGQPDTQPDSLSRIDYLDGVGASRLSMADFFHLGWNSFGFRHPSVRWSLRFMAFSRLDEAQTPDHPSIGYPPNFRAIS